VVVLDPELLAGLEEAVEAAPENKALHYHLIALLLNGGLADRALGHAQWLLLHEPDNGEALMFAAHAAEALEDEDRAGRYRRIAEALAAYPG
jgi:Flp pilus assembly protein TadD